MEVLFASVPIGDLPAGISFYERLFGRPADIVPHEDEVMWQVAGSGWLYVIRDHQRAGSTVVTISVSDLGRFVAELSARGIEAAPIVAVGAAGKRAELTDPCGNVITLIEVATGD
jgi:predicted enzyme related to lactoylglutathione lyase